MIATATTMTATTTTTAAASHFASIAGIVAVVALILCLVTKELLNSTEGEKSDVSGDDRPASKAELLAKRADIAIFSLLFVFAAIVLTKVLEVLG